MSTNEQPYFHVTTECEHIGGRLSSRTNAWEAITSDKTILNSESGYEYEFECAELPMQIFIPKPYKLNSEEISAVDECHGVGL